MKTMVKSSSHNRDLESDREKAKWFQSLSLEERMDYLCMMTDLILENNPQIAEAEDAQPPAKRVRILGLARG